MHPAASVPIESGQRPRISVGCEEYDQAMELQTRPVGGRYTAVKLRPEPPVDEAAIPPAPHPTPRPATSGGRIRPPVPAPPISRGRSAGALPAARAEAVAVFGLRGTGLPPPARLLQRSTSAGFLRGCAELHSFHTGGVKHVEVEIISVREVVGKLVSLSSDGLGLIGIKHLVRWQSPCTLQKYADSATKNTSESVSRLVCREFDAFHRHPNGCAGFAGSSLLDDTSSVCDSWSAVS
ncbi:unnamed protein product [Symbiodinium microadriaticum]|nr:unnamed protein product [Symbiodinium microadriaticum]